MPYIYGANPLNGDAPLHDLGLELWITGGDTNPSWVIRKNDYSGFERHLMSGGERLSESEHAAAARAHAGHGG